MLLEQSQQSWHNMAEKTYYWIGRGEFGGGDDAVKFGEKMPKLEKDQLDLYLEKEWVSDKAQVTERKLSELEDLKQKYADLKNGQSETVKSSIDEALKTSVQSDLDEIAALKAKGGSGITQAQLDTAKGESVQADLNKIKELEEQLEEATKPKVKK